MGRKTTIEVDEYDRNIIIRALNDLRTALLKENRPTDPVDDLMVRIYESNKKRQRLGEERQEYECR